jgi:hypothetical protein
MDFLVMHFFGRIYVAAMISQTNVQTGVAFSAMPRDNQEQNLGKKR